MTETLILVGAKPSKRIAHPGGQLTASIGIIDFVKNHSDYTLEIIDTTQSSFPVPSFFSRLKKGWSRVRELISLLAQRNVVGVIIFSSSGFSFYERSFLAAICRIFRVKVVFFVRSGHFVDSINRSAFQRFAATILLRIPNVLGAQGASWRAFYNRLGVSDDHISVIRNWLPSRLVSVSEPKRYSGEGVVKFVYVGWLVEKKGVLELLEAALLFSGSKRFSLAIIGGGDLDDYCRDFVERNYLAASVKLLGWCDAQVVTKNLDEADVFVLPSKAEGFPNAMLEAMGRGLPVIASDVGGVSDSLKDGLNGFLLEQADAESIFNAMNKYIADPSMIEQHSRATIGIVQRNHSYQDNCQKLISIFRQPK